MRVILLGEQTSTKATGVSSRSRRLVPMERPRQARSRPESGPSRRIEAVVEVSATEDTAGTVEADTATEAGTGRLGGEETARTGTADEAGSTEAGTATEEADGPTETEEVAGMEIGITNGVVEEATQTVILSSEEEAVEVIATETMMTIVVISGEIKMTTEATEAEVGMQTETDIETMKMVLIDTEAATVTAMMNVEAVGIMTEAEEADTRKTTTTESKTVDGEMIDQEEMVGDTSIVEVEATIMIEMKEVFEVHTTAATAPEVEIPGMMTGLGEERKTNGQKAKMMAGVKKKKTKTSKTNLNKKIQKNPDKQDISEEVEIENTNPTEIIKMVMIE